jgi:putative transposase
VDERLRFVARLLDGEKMAGLCKEFGISRKTGYKIYDRYKDHGALGLTDRSRRPYRHANRLPVPIEAHIVRLKREYPSWGAPKIRERLRRKYPDLRCPAISTVHAVLDRHGLVERRVRRRYKARGTALSRPLQPNELWCADFKGEFMLADRRYCFPLTISDFATRYLLRCEALTSTKEGTAFTSSSAPSRSLVYRSRFAPTTASRLAAVTRSMASHACRCGGCAWASASSASSQVIPSRMAATSACI